MLTQALETIKSNPKWSKEAAMITGQIHNGSTFSQALEICGPKFSSLLINLVRVGEQSGQLVEALSGAADYFENKAAFQKQLVKSLSYPILVLSLSLLSLVFLILFVLPTFSGLLQELKVPLPAITRILLFVGNFFSNFGILVLIALSGLTWLGYRWYEPEENKFKLDAFLLEHQYLRGFTYHYYLVRISQSLSIMLGGGLPLLAAWKITKEMVPNRKMQSQFDQVAGELEKGKPFSEALKTAGIDELFLVQMVEIGEKIGNLDRTFLEVSRIYQDELEEKLSSLVMIIEPASTLIVGGVVAGIALSIFVPLMSVLTNFN